MSEGASRLMQDPRYRIGAARLMTDDRWRRTDIGCLMSGVSGRWSGVGWRFALDGKCKMGTSCPASRMKIYGMPPAIWLPIP